MKVVKTVEEVAKFSAQESQHITVSNRMYINILYISTRTLDLICNAVLPILCGKFYKEKSHPLKELIRVTSECGEGFLGNLAEELLRVHLATTVMLPPPWHTGPSPGGWRMWASRCWPAS